MNDMNIPEEEYRALIKEFNPTYFSAKYIVSKAKEWGMRYIVLTVKHHEGFALYNSRCSSYNVMHTPYGKDILKENAAGMSAAGNYFGSVLFTGTGIGMIPMVIVPIVITVRNNLKNICMKNVCHKLKRF